MEMKEMIYGGKTELLYETTVADHQIAVVNVRGSHPCAYVRIPDDVLEKAMARSNSYADYDCWDADVHGGFTYGEFGKPHGFEELRDGFWLGWDYGHAGDYMHIDAPMMFVFPSRYEKKRWTTAEIASEAITAIPTIEFDGI